MSRYFHISQGLRGCYMPDSAYVIRCDTRRDLKAALESEAYYIRDAGFIGCSKRGVASLAAMLWRRADPKARHSFGDSVLPYRNADSPGNYAFALMGSPATRDEWKESQEDCC